MSVFVVVMSVPSIAMSVLVAAPGKPLLFLNGSILSESLASRVADLVRVLVAAGDGPEHIRWNERTELGDVSRDER